MESITVNHKIEFFIILTIGLVCIHRTNAVPVPEPTPQKLLPTSLEDMQTKFDETKKLLEQPITVASGESLLLAESKNGLADFSSQEQSQLSQQSQQPSESILSRQTKSFDFNSNEITPDSSSRQDKMLGYFGYYPQPMPNPFFQQVTSPQDYFMGYSGGNSVVAADEEDILSRANRRRPQSSVAQYENSPIFYIRLPPTPYMFVPGLGYISNPPSITPMNAMQQQIAGPPQPPPPQMMPQQMQSQLGSYSPFNYVPLNFVSNGKPTNIYQWSGASGYGHQAGGYPQHPGVYPTHPHHHQQQTAAGYGPQQSIGYPQQSIGYPQNYPSHHQHPQQQQAGHYPMGGVSTGINQGGYRPQRPSYKPKPFLPDSKIHNLKGQYLFNGRPEEIYLLQNNYNQLYHHHQVQDTMPHHYY